MVAAPFGEIEAPERAQQGLFDVGHDVHQTLCLVNPCLFCRCGVRLLRGLHKPSRYKAVADLNRNLAQNCETNAPCAFRERFAEISQRTLKVLTRLLMLPSPVEGLAHLPFEGGPLDGIPFFPEDPRIGLQGLVVVGEGFGVCGYPACLVACLEEVLLGLLPEFRPGIMIGKDARELLEPVGEEGFYGGSDFSVKLMAFFQEDALVGRLLDEGVLEDVFELRDSSVSPGSAPSR